MASTICVPRLKGSALRQRVPSRSVDKPLGVRPGGISFLTKNGVFVLQGSVDRKPIRNNKENKII